MFVSQFELDIAIEVQKRGRIFRTGQLNYPSYTYCITKIASESRKYLIFRLKLRKLDANVSANQTQSAASFSIRDANNQVVENIFNYYGYKMFIDTFLPDDDNRTFKAIYDRYKPDSRLSQATSNAATAEKKEISESDFIGFSRELEYETCAIQRAFYDKMNALYAVEKARLIGMNEYQEELETQNYKAKLKQAVVIQINSGETSFSLPLFLEDYYTLETKRAMSKVQVEELSNKLREGKDIDTYMADLKADIIKAYDEKKAKAIENYDKKYSVKPLPANTTDPEKIKLHQDEVDFYNSQIKGIGEDIYFDQTSALKMFQW
jgi:hypothetical protein